MNGLCDGHIITVLNDCLFKNVLSVRFRTVELQPLMVMVFAIQVKLRQYRS